MEKSYNLFLQSEHDSNNAIDDILNCSERQEDTEWNFKNDLLSDDSHIAAVPTDNRRHTISDSLDGVSCLHDVCAKREDMEAKSSCTHSFNFDTL